jgi:hypothetical protein
MPEMTDTDGRAARPAPAPRRLDSTVFVGVALSLAWSAWLLRGWRVEVLGARWHVLLDDALISMRYAHNLASGQGLVWNAHERVEGFSNPLWTLLMALTHLVDLPLPWRAFPMQVVAALCLAGCVWQTVRLVRALGGSSRLAEGIAAVACIAASPLSYFSLLGMEVAGLALLCTFALAEAASGRPLGWRFAAALGLGTWIRVDAAWLMTALALVAAYRQDDRKDDRKDDRRADRGLLWRCALAIGAGVALQTVMRLLYYGELLPNTYALKMSGYPAGRRALRGALVLGRWLLDSGWPILSLAIAARVLAGRRVAAPLAILGALAAYSIWVGGDAWEFLGGPNRYLLPALPALLALAALGAVRLAERTGKLLGGRGTTAIALGLGLALVVGENASRFADAPGWHVQLGLAPPVQLVWQSRILDPGLCVRQAMGPSAVFAVTWAGTLPYYAGGPFVDLLGKSDAHIARLPMHREDDRGQWDYFLPGHLKWDYAWSIGRYAPDAVFQLHLHPEQAEAALKRDYQWAQVCGRPIVVRRTPRPPP